MNIGFIKFGLKVYFNKNDSSQGSNHEVVSVFKIFEKYGHTCKMVSGSDIGQDIKFKPDVYFVFNGPMSKTMTSGIMLNRYTFPYFEILNKTKIPWVYFRTDIKNQYEISDKKLITHKPEIVLSQGIENYSHLDKLILYKNSLRKITSKKTLISILANGTINARNKNIIEICELFDNIEIHGKWKEKNQYLKEPIEFDKIQKYLDNVKYSYNLLNQNGWQTQKFWEMIISNVICFYTGDNSNNTIPSYLLLPDIKSIKNAIDYLESNPEIYNKILQKQRKLIKKEYTNGEFLYNIIKEKLKTLNL